MWVDPGSQIQFTVSGPRIPCTIFGEWAHERRYNLRWVDLGSLVQFKMSGPRISCKIYRKWTQDLMYNLQWVDPGTQVNLGLGNPGSQVQFTVSGPRSRGKIYDKWTHDLRCNLRWVDQTLIIWATTFEKCALLFCRHNWNQYVTRFLFIKHFPILVWIVNFEACKLFLTPSETEMSTWVWTSWPTSILWL